MRVGIVGTVVVALALSLCSAAGATTVDFESPALADGTQVTTQFQAAKGVTFVKGAPTGAVGQPKMYASGAAHGGTHALNISTDNAEFPHPDLAGQFSTTRSQVSLWARSDDGAANNMVLDALDSTGHVIATSTSHDLASGGAWVQFSVSTGGPATIVSFRLHSTVATTAAFVRVDDLQYDDPVTATPDFSLGADPATYVVPAGGTVSVPIAINRINGSSGPITFSDTSGDVDVSFSANPVPADATSVTATVHLPAYAGTYLDGIFGTPGAGAGSDDRHVVVTFVVQTPVALAPAAGQSTLDLPPCTSGQSHLTLTRATGLTGPAELTLGTVPSPFSASLDPPSPLAGYATTLTVNRGDALTDDGTTASVVATMPGYTTSDTAHVTVHALAPSLSAAAGTRGTAAGNAPAALIGGERVTLTGAGLCPGSRVRFGNAAAEAPLDVSDNGTRATTNVPRLATDGPLTVISPAGRQTPGPAFDVSGYRDTNGFRFPNVDYQGDIGSWFDEFGPEQFFLSADPCALLTFGAAHCPVPTPIPNPLSYIVFGIADRALVDAHGSCFGFSLASRRIATGRGPSPATFGGGSTVWSIPDGAQIKRYIWAQHVGQISAEVLAQVWKQRTGGALSLRSAGELRGRIEQALHRGSRPILTLTHGGAGHAINAYDVVDPQPDGGFTIRIYNSNAPFTTDEQGADGTAATGAERNSEIVVHGDGRWSMPELGWEGGLGDIVVIDEREIPDHPTLPTTPESLVTIVFGSGDAAPAAASASASGAGLRRFPFLDDPSPAPLLVGDGTRAHDIAVSPGHGGNLDAVLAGGGQGTRVTAAGLTGATSVSEGAHNTSLGLTFGRASRVTLALGAQAGKHATRSVTAAFSGALRGGDSVALAKGGGYRVVHRGGPATLHLALAGAGASAPVAFNGAVRISGAAQVGLRPDWRRAGRTLRVTIRQHGHTRTVRLRNRARAAAPVRRVHVSAKRRGRTVTVTVSARIGGKAARAVGAVAVTVARGRKLLARGGQARSGRALRRTRLTLHLPRGAKGPFRVRAVVTTVGSGTAVSAPSTQPGSARLH